MMVKERIDEAETAITSTRESRDSDTKSTAGDKHEVGRAMIQIELDNQEAQLINSKQLLDQLEKVDLTRLTDEASFGSLIHADNGNYFISIGIGKVEVQGHTCYVISKASLLAA